MKTRRQWFGSVIAVALFGAFLSAGASSAQAQAKKTGWWIRINKAKMEATSVSFQVGTHKDDSGNWRAWKPGYRAEFDLPAALRNSKELYIRATTEPHNKDASFCVFYQGHGVEHFKFDGDKDHQMDQTHSDNDCHP